ncbi:MAG: glucosaminidase domain-containing protein [Peptostreptococcaceae bacterium]|nr:glucosaminidase domain-containing protein [Peptostreptococcaceae bacterium]
MKTMKQRQFIEKILGGAQEGYRRHGILPSLTLAQAILESGWGEHSIENNVFGIKAGNLWGGKTKKALTKEVIDGKEIQVEAVFRAYDSIEESVCDHTKLLTLPRYDPVRKAKDYKEACRAVFLAGYATDPKYPEKLIRIIEENRLFEYDRRESMNPKEVCADPKQLDAETQKALALFLRKCKEKNLPVKVFETYRSQERQEYLYAQGRTRSGNVVTWTKQSFHTSRRAFDIIHETLNWNAPEAFWKSIAEIGRSIGLTCGYDWKQKDRPHFQLDQGKKAKEEDEYMVEKTKIKVNGEIIEVDRVLIENRNFIKLADLEKAGFAVGYDPNTKTPSLDTE